VTATVFQRVAEVDADHEVGQGQHSHRDRTAHEAYGGPAVEDRRVRGRHHRNASQPPGTQ
jgi:hypothetical protein